jgi:hypothetical protein
MIAIVTLVFSICWLPLTLYIISANIFNHRTPFLYYFKIIANSFAYLNSAINPVLYAFLNRSFRNNCGSLFSERSCVLFCGEEHYPPQIQQQPKLLPSTQIDRFSYQSTMRQTSPTSQVKKKSRTLSIGINENQLSPDFASHNDFSDGECEISDVECVGQFPLEKNTNQNHLPPNQHEPLLINETNGLNTQTTSL